MTGPPPHDRAAVAGRVAARALDLADAPRAGRATYEIDWAGPVRLPLSDERSVQAACGIMHVHGRAAGRPAPLAVDYASAVAGVLAAQGALAVLIARSRGLALDRARTSVAQAALLAVTQYLAAATADDAPESLEPGDCSWATSDGVLFEFETLDPHRWQDFWRLLGAPPADVSRGWLPFQQRFATATCPLPVTLHEAVARVPFRAVRHAAGRAGVSVLAVREDPFPPMGIRPWSRTPFPERAAARPRPAVALPLDGLRVVESTRRVQGPLAGHVLRLLGAQVMRIEPPGGDPMRGIPPMAGTCSARFSALNAEKTVAEVDITTDAGRREVHDLVARADVFLHNWAPGKAAQLRLDAEDLRRTRPGLVYAWASGWGDALGPRPPVGTDFLVQARSGLAAALRPADEAPVPSLMTLTDVLGGLVCAQGVLAALLTRIRTGHGGRVDSSLLSAAAVIPRRRRRVEWSPLDRPLRTADGYLALGPEARARPELVARITGPGASADLAATLLRFRVHPTGYWSPLLREAGLTATPVCTDLRDLPRAPAFREALATAEHVFPRAPWEFS
ncbi:CoA transferase [Streptomyces sp. Ru73]|uniref:CoA transferase n=1 Tax=Streptomyces sp. Ru73 TaxID=2080748 RepID=UPI000CDE24F1|nr:CoA transferase [Streptomyces sp. Ru73]POX38918.1 CoA transferase [Streptomyces sp. Ru73]